MTDKKLIHRGKLLSLYRERVELRTDRHTYFDIVKHPGGAVIAAINDNNEICLVHQWRHAVQKVIWELPAGCLEIGEPPMETAKRELEEEAGIIADNWIDLGTIIPSPGFSDEILYFYVAKTLHAGQQKLDDAEQLEVHWVALDDAYQMAQDGRITDAKTVAMLFRLSRL